MKRNHQEKRNTIRDTILAGLSHELTAASVQLRNDVQNTLIQDAINSAKFHKAFLPLKIMRDYYRGVHTEYKDSDVHNVQPVLVRDARLQTNNTYLCEAGYYKYVQLGFNYLNGMIDLLEIENDQREEAKKIDIDKAKKTLKTLAQNFYNDITPTDPDDTEQQKQAEQEADAKFARFFHKAIVPFYRQYRPELSTTELHTELKLGRNFANMKVSPYAVATITRHDIQETLRPRNDHKTTIDVVECEVPMTELTNTQKHLYEYRQGYDWYTNQSPLARALIDRYEQKIREDGAMIPAQLIYHLIGTRNGYEKTIAVLNPSEEATVLNTAYHAGSQAHLLKLSDPENAQARKDAARSFATEMTVEQLHELTKAGVKKTDLTINTLVTPLSINKDAKIARQIRDAVEKSNTEKQSSKTDTKTPSTATDTETPATATDTEKTSTAYANLPQNIGRQLGMCNISGIKALLEKENVPPLYTCHRDLSDALQRTSRFHDPNNNNLEIATLANLLVHAMNQIQDDIHYVLVSGCLSGQDRSGMLSTHTTNEAIIRYLFKDNVSNPILPTTAAEQIKSIRETQAKAGHTAEMAGNAGTGFGGEGIKAKSVAVIPKSYSPLAIKHLTSKTGKYNEHIPKNPNRPCYKKKSFWIGAALLLLGAGLCATGILALKGMIALGVGSKIIAGTMIATGTGSTLTAIKNHQHAKPIRLAAYDYFAAIAEPNSPEVSDNESVTPPEGSQEGDMRMEGQNHAGEHPTRPGRVTPEPDDDGSVRALGNAGLLGSPEASNPGGQRLYWTNQQDRSKSPPI